LVQPVPSFATGNEQAADFGLTHLYSSLMIRAVMTASYVAEALGLPLVAWPEAHEVGGIYETEDDEERIGQPGNNRAYFAANYPHLLLPESLGESGWWNRPAETREEAVERARDFWRLFLERHGGSDDRVGLVTHGGFFQRLMMTLVNPEIAAVPPLPANEKTGGERPLSVEAIRRVWFDIQNTSITRIDFFDVQAAIVYHNRVVHLPVDLITCRRFSSLVHIFR
jgi:2,3-bisphosphoglycerate-dependent phosphoglycerate mutase